MVNLISHDYGIYFLNLIFFLFDVYIIFVFFFFSSRRRHTRWTGDWSSDVCSSDLNVADNQVGPLLSKLKTCFDKFRTYVSEIPTDDEQGLNTEEDSSIMLFNMPARSEERRVGKECRSRWSPSQ